MEEFDKGFKLKPDHIFTIQASAKINLTLEVLDKRKDGFHEIVSVMQSISLSDTLDFYRSDKMVICHDIRGLDPEENLVFKGAWMIKNETGTNHGVKIKLNKKIPMASGLGGGSSDAAATLVGLNRIWRLGLTDDDLSILASRLGSDVPFFIRGGTAFVKGRGEVVQSLTYGPKLHFVLAVPNQKVQNKTATLYKSLDSRYFTNGQHTVELAHRLNKDDIRFNIKFTNAFEGVAYNVFRDLSRAKSILLNAGLTSVHLSGTGPALFGRVEGMEEGKRVVRKCARDGLTAYVVRSIGPTDGKFKFNERRHL